jgi:hypothetical protein
MTELFTAEELRDLSVPPAGRLKRLVDQGDFAAAAQFAERVQEARRGTCNRYVDWLTWTVEYTRLVGLELTVERITELAARSGFDHERLNLAQRLCAGADDPIGGRLRTALSDGDGVETLTQWRRLEFQMRAIHDLRRDLISAALSDVYRRDGVDGLREAQLFAAERGWWRESMPRDLALAPATRLTELAFFLVACAYFRLAIEEFEDRWVCSIAECGRCGRQLRDRYDDPAWGLEIVTETGPSTYGQPAMTIYQSHAAIIHGTYAIRHVGAPWPVFECRGLDGGAGGCRILVYKDPQDTPAEVYAQLGCSR